MINFGSLLKDLVLWFGGMVAVLAAAWLLTKCGKRIARTAFRFLGEASTRSRLVLFFPFITSLAISTIVFTIAKPPRPHIHDEFAHLLAADTFSHGRLTNSTPLDWPSFETMHVLMHPTYMSKFGPAQGFTLAIGQVVFGQPWVGLILATALACLSMTWCLRAFAPPRWAMIGGMLAAVHPEIVIWSHEYWGGNVGIIGGALVLGALARLDNSMRSRRSLAPSRGTREDFQSAALLALGLGILANSRPYEAAVWGIIFATWLMYRIARPAQNKGSRFARIVLAGALVLAPIGAFMGYYNQRITGQATRLPYTEHVEQYMAVPLFFWQKLPPPKAYANPQFTSQFDGYERAYFAEQTNLRGWLHWAVYKLFKYAEFHLLRNLVLSLGLIAFIASRYMGARKALDPRMRLSLFSAGAFVLAYAIIPWFEDHYTGASLAILFVISLHGVRLLRARFKLANRKRIGRAMLRFAAVFCIATLAFVTLRERRNQTLRFQSNRASAESVFAHDGGKHLVIVCYQPDHQTGDEWVYNSADLATANVIWARHLTDDADASVVRDYGTDRTVWKLYPDETPWRMERE